MSKSKIGIIGGAGPLASALLYRLVIEECYKKKKNLPEILLINFPFTRGLQSSESQQNHNILQEELSYCLDILRSNNIELAAIACNTLHFFLTKEMQRSLKFIHLPKNTLEKLKSTGFKKILLLGTQTTSTSNVYSCNHTKLLYANNNSQRDVSRIIDTILEGSIKNTQTEKLLKISKRLFDIHRFEALLLGCTELSLLNDRFPLRSNNFKIIDPLKILAKTLVEEI